MCLLYITKCLIYNSFAVADLFHQQYVTIFYDYLFLGGLTHKYLFINGDSIMYICI